MGTEVDEARAFITTDEHSVSYTVQQLTPHGAVLEGGPFQPLEQRMEMTLVLPLAPPIKAVGRVIHAIKSATGAWRLMVSYSTGTARSLSTLPAWAAP